MRRDVVSHAEDPFHRPAVRQQRLEAPVDQTFALGRGQGRLELGAVRRPEEALHCGGEADREGRRPQEAELAERLSLRAVGEHPEGPLERGRQTTDAPVAIELDDELMRALEQKVEDGTAAVLVDPSRPRPLVEHEQRRRRQHLPLGPVGRLGRGHRTRDDAYPDRRAAAGQQVVLERPGEEEIVAHAGSGALAPPRHEVVPIGTELLVARGPEEVEEGTVGGEQHAVGRDHAERLAVRQVADHLDELPQLRPYRIGDAPV